MNNSLKCVANAWQLYESDILHWLIKQSGSSVLAHDLLQDTFIKAMNSGFQFCQLENPKAWLMKVAKNCLIDHARLQKMNTSAEISLLPEHTSQVAPIVELSECIARNIVFLSDKDRDIIEKCDLERMKHTMYATQQNLSVDAVKSRLKRARQKLRVLITENCQLQYDETGHICCHRSKLT